MWICGKLLYCERCTFGWSVIGVFTSEELAVAACGEDPNIFIGPIVVDERLPDELKEWPGSYFPADGSQKRDSDV